MAAAILAQRDLTAIKLNESVRQLKRYLESGGNSKRIIDKRYNRIESEKDELINYHYRYAEKSGTSVEDDNMKQFLAEKTDAAEDILNDALINLDEFTATDVEGNKQNEITMFKRETVMNEELVLFLLDEISKVLAVERPTDDDVINVETFLSELREKEKSLMLSFASLKAMLDEDTAENYSKKETSLKITLSKMYAEMKLFIKKNSESADVNLNKSELKDVRSKASIRLEKIKPPTFSGNIRNFARFKADFEAIIKPAYEDEMYITYVLKKSCLFGNAYELVKNLEREDEIWRRLEEKYGDTIDIVDSVITDLQNINIGKFSQDNGMVQLVDILEKGIMDLTSIDKKHEIANAYTVKLLEQKLPRRVMMKWLEEKDRSEGDDRFEALFKFLKEERKILEKIIHQRGDNEKSTSASVKDKFKRKEVVNTIRDGKIEDDKSKINNRCLIHQNSNHLTRKCKLFLAKSVAERNKLVLDLDACKLCLSLSHVGNPCPWLSKWNPCDVNGCGEYHSRLLHENHYLKSKCNAASNVETNTLLLIQKADAGKNNIVILWDTGSSISLVRKGYAYKHKLTGINVSYELITLGNGPKLQNTVLFDVPVYDRDKKKHIIKAYAIDQISTGDENIDISEVVGIFTDLDENEVQRRTNNVDILIGMDYAQLQPTPVQRCANLVLYESLFGTGRLLGGQHEIIKGCNQTSMFAKTVAHVKYVKIELLKPRTSVDFFSAESFGVNVPAKCKRCKSCKECTFEVNQISRCEQYELEVIKQNLKLDCIQKKWTTTYPYKLDPAVLRDNRDQADGFLRRTEKRISKNDIVKDQYCKQFQDLIDRGVFRELPDAEIRDYMGPTFYITHHEVYKTESSSTPVRIVSNTSLKNNDGISLNDILMKGPNSLNNIFGIQLRFRTFPCALVGDISKMYNSIDTTVKERHLRRVLWRNLNINENPKVYGVEKVMFGDKPAAAISATAISLTAERFKYIDEVASEKIKTDIYVDDITTGDSTVYRTMRLKENIRKILSEGGFKVKGFVMSGDSSEESLSLLGTGEIGRILGIGWKPCEDVFVARVRINTSRKFKGVRKEANLDDSQIYTLADGKLTRRMLLSITNSCYDPVGILSPVTVQLKIELRKLYSKELGLSWDADIPQEMKLEWVKLVKKLKSIDNIEIRRCVHDVDSVEDPELVIFCDGSPLAMCAVAYIRWELPNQKYSSYLFAAKTRVTPIERITIPRVEMQSAVLAVRLGNSIVKSSGYEFRTVSYISDSTCTLATLKKDSVALKEYMGNRVAEINASTNSKQWYHVKSRDNIADLGTRMEATAKDIAEGSTWQKGPAWLVEDRRYWPVSQNLDNVIVPEEELLKKGISYHNEKKEMFIDITKYRSYSFLINVTARILLVFEEKSFKVVKITLLSLEKAEKYWIKQSMLYTKEELENGRLRSLRPQIDKDGVITIGSRALEGMKHHYNAESFPILVYKDPLAALWMKEIHKEDHSGVTKTVAKSRRKFWIIKARRLAQKTRYMCYKCRLLDHKWETQLMSPLPLFRQSIAPVFHVTSLDLFGPFLVKDMVKKRTKMKVWGLICTCAATRAIPP